MLKKIKIIPLAAESFGVRSMATVIETPDAKILIDPGCALGPRRGDGKKFYYPHPLEYKALKDCTEKIIDISKKAEFIVISHYHHDHYKPSFTDYFTIHSNKDIAREIFKDKIIYAKDFHDHINASQRKRGFLFNKILKDHFKEIFWADSKTFQLGNTKLAFSAPVFHGEQQAKGGWVLMCTISFEDEKFLFTSDVQGPMIEETMIQIKEQKPNMAYIGGPPVYLGDIIAVKDLEMALKHLKTLAAAIPFMIIDHHLLRHDDWRKWADPVFSIALEQGHEVISASEVLKKSESLLEANREKLWKKDPPNEQFLKWLDLPQKKREKIPPPLP